MSRRSRWALWSGLAYLVAGAGCGWRSSQARPAYAFSTPDTTSGGVATAATEEAITVASVASENSYSGGSSGPPTSPPMATNSAVSAPAAEMIVVEGWLHIRVSDVGTAADEIRKKVGDIGGRIIADEVQSAGPRPSDGRIVLRVPPGQVESFLVFLADLGQVDYRRIQGTDVSREYHDRDLNLQNQKLTLARLEKILDNPNLDTKSVLEVEKEMSRVRGQIEQLEGAQRFLIDRSAMATIEVVLGRHGPDADMPEAKFHPGVRGSYLFNIGGNASIGDARPGIGLNLNLERYFTMDIDFFPVHNGEDLIVLATMGGSVYSDYLGGGQRRFLNPYLGLRIGAGADGEAKFVVGGELGVELLKLDSLLVEVSGRVIGLIGDTSSAMLQVGAGISVPF